MECTCPPVCGDGFVGAGEQCDPGDPGGTAGRRPRATPRALGFCSPTDCQCTVTLPQCGNGTVDAGEACELPSVGCGPGELCIGCGQCIPFLAICGNANLVPG